jgi:C4-dicarboxylate-specific signal transduction histidine kinase
VSRLLDWIEPELPADAADLGPRARDRLLARARLDVLRRTYTGTFVYPVLAVAIGWIVGLTDEYPRVVASVASVFAAIVVVRVLLHRRAIADTNRPSLAGRLHLFLGVVTVALLSGANGVAYILRNGDASITPGCVAISAISATVAMIASTHRRLAKVWVLASILPGVVVFVVEGSPTSHMLLAMYALYLPILRMMIARGHETFWEAQMNAARLDQQAHELARLSRIAGMAENATNVLHDVGNTLNVVKTSATCIERELPGHPAADLARLVAMIDSHAHDLPAFLADRERAERIVAFLRALASSSEAHAVTTRQDVARLTAGVRHIEAIVRRQQDIAATVGTAETCGVTDLVGDALGLSRLAAASGVTIEQSLDTNLRVLADRHRTLQILVNLLENAMDAVKDAPDEPAVRIRAARDGAEAVLIEVSDNGCGIADDVAARIFARGFTTKPHGHGFGLHGSCAVAQAMGGELSFTSAGPGTGATFRLRMPCADA